MGVCLNGSSEEVSRRQEQVSLCPGLSEICNVRKRKTSVFISVWFYSLRWGLTNCPAFFELMNLFPGPLK